MPSVLLDYVLLRRASGKKCDDDDSDDDDDDDNDNDNDDDDNDNDNDNDRQFIKLPLLANRNNFIQKELLLIVSSYTVKYKVFKTKMSCTLLKSKEVFCHNDVYPLTLIKCTK